MGLSSRDLWIVIRARDEASRSLRNINNNFRDIDKTAREASQRQMRHGQAMVTAGVGMAAVGTGIALTMNDAAQAAMEYNKEAAKTLTQVDDMSVSLDDVKKVALDVGKAIPAPFEQMQGSLYDIFSSMDVNVSESKTLLTSFSKSAVAGQVSLQDSGRATIGIMNAFKLKTEDVTHVQDVMFQLVRKGVGTYGQFATTIGRATPSAVRAGQSIEGLSGMLAFLTRNGLSAAMASSSAARALDAISNPKTATKLKGLGALMEKTLGKNKFRAYGLNAKALSMSITDSAGKIKPMTQIITELSKRLDKLTDAEKAAVLQEIFKGSGGTIQARRFFDPAIRNVKQLTSLTNAMSQSAGVAGQAYATMADTAAAKQQLLNNKWQEAKISFGEQLLPYYVKGIELLSKMVTWFDNLSAGTKKTIVVIGLIAGAVLFFGGIAVAAAGSMLILTAALGKYNITVATSTTATRAFVTSLIGMDATATAGSRGVAAQGAAFGKFAATLIIAAAAYTGLVYAESKFFNQFSDINTKVPEATKNLKDFADVADRLAAGGAVNIKGTALSDQAYNLQSIFKPNGGEKVGNAMQQVASTASFGMFHTQLSQQKKELETYDAALTKMVKSGHSEEAAKAFSAITAAAAAQGVSIDQVKSKFPGYTEAASTAATKLEKFQTAIGLTEQADINFKNSLGDLRTALKGVNEKLDLNSTKGLQVRQSILQVMGAARDHADAVYQQTGSMKKASAAFQNQITDMMNTKGMTKELRAYIALLVGSYNSIPSNVNTTLTVHVNTVQGVQSSAITGPDYLIAVNSYMRQHHVNRKKAEAAINKKLGKSGYIDTAQIAADLAKGIPPPPDTTKKKGGGSSAADKAAAAAAKAKAAAERKAERIREAKLTMKQDLTTLKELGSSGTNAQYKAAGKKAVADVEHLFKAGAISAKKRDSLEAYIQSRTKMLRADADAMAKLDSSIANKQKKLDELKQKADDFRKSVNEGIVGKSLMSSDYNNTGLNGYLRTIKKQSTDADAFIANIKKLQNMGLDASMIQELAGQGPEAVGRFVQTLTRATPAQIKEINDTHKKLADAGKTFSTAMYDQYYKAGIQSAQGIIDGLKSQKKDLQDTMNSVAQGMVDYLKKKLGIKSPATALMPIGHHSIGGIIKGLEKRRPDLRRAMDSISQDMEGRTGNRMYQFGDGGGGKTINQDITIHTQEINPRKHAADLGWELAGRVG